MLLERAANVGQSPYFRLCDSGFMCAVDVFDRLDVEAVMIIARHLILVFDLDDGIDMFCAKPDHPRNRASLRCLDAEEYFVEAPRFLQVVALQRPVRQEPRRNGGSRRTQFRGT